jgi:hypothetical protein
LVSEPPPEAAWLDPPEPAELAPPLLHAASAAAEMAQMTAESALGYAGLRKDAMVIPFKGGQAGWPLLLGCGR